MEPCAFTVVALNGRAVRLSEPPDCTIGDVRLRVACELREPPERLRLVWGPHVLRDAQSLDDVGLPRSGATIGLLVSRGQLALSGDLDGELRLWDLGEGSCL